MTCRPVIQIKQISKSFGTQKVLKDISFSVVRGEIFGIVGPDGAGKTTLFRILATLLSPDKGTALLDGYNIENNIREIRSSIGYMPGRFSLYTDLSVRENLEFFAALYDTDISADYDLIAPIYKQLKPFEKRRAGHLSGGMKQKLALSCALIHHPEIVLLDEPTTGVDAVSRKEFWDILTELKNRGMTVVVSTPYMDEAIRCDRIALMFEGKILKTGTVEQLTASFSYPLYAVAASNMFGLLKTLRSLPDTHECYPFGATLHWVTRKKMEKAVLHATLDREGLENVQIQEISPTIEDLFITLMQ